jgi:hypothetical protein
MEYLYDAFGGPQFHAPPNEYGPIGEFTKLLDD